MSMFDHRAFKLGTDMMTHPCFKSNKEKVLSIPDKRKLGWLCSACGTEWALCSNPNRIRHVLRVDLNIFTKAMSRAVCIAEEEPA